MTRNYQAETAASITALAQRIMDTNLCKEIFLTEPVAMTLDVFYSSITPKYTFSRAKWYDAEYDWAHYYEVIEWCTQQFGPHPACPDAWSRWCNHHTAKIRFRDEKDYAWFMLRWS